MPVRPLRRIAVPARTSLYDRIRSEALSCAWSRPEIDAIERDHAGLVLEREGSLLTAWCGDARANLAYSFTGDRAFVDEFPAMFEELLPRLRRELGAERVRFRLSHGPSRPAVEPVLKNLWFEPARAWWLFSLDKGHLRPPAAPRGPAFTFADGDAADIDDILRVDRESFPDTPLPRAAVERLLARGERAMLARIKGDVAAVALYSMPEPDLGYLHVLGVREAYRRRGIGGALSARVAGRMFRDGAVRIELRTDDDNAAAIALYRGLGFKHAGAGRDYDRPADPDEVRRIRRSKRGVLIRYGGWR